jgi:hypothetical protein
LSNIESHSSLLLLNEEVFVILSSFYPPLAFMTLIPRLMFAVLSWLMKHLFWSDSESSSTFLVSVGSCYVEDRHIRSEIVVVTAGPDAVKYQIHRSLLVAKSAFFSAAFKNDGFLESRTGELHIMDELPEAVELFHTWLWR